MKKTKTAKETVVKTFRISKRLNDLVKKHDIDVTQVCRKAIHMWVDKYENFKTVKRKND